MAVRFATFMKKRRFFLVLLGPPGCGKTYIVAAMMRWAVLCFNNFRVWKEFDLLKHLREGMNRGWDATEQLKLAIDDSLVVVDDLGSQGYTEWREKIMFELIELRYSSERPTIFTTNLSKEDFKNLYDPRISSRLFAAQNTVLDFSGDEDLRITGF